MVLGDGIVIFGTIASDTTDLRNLKWLTKMPPAGQPSLPVIAVPGGSISVSPSADVNRTLIFPGPKEIRVPHFAPEFAVGSDAKTNVLLHLHDIADGLVLASLQVLR
jgi:hypothetical protein